MTTTPLSPAAQAVMAAYYGQTPMTGSKRAAVVLRAAADHITLHPQKTDKDEISIDSLHLCVRVSNALKRHNVWTIRDLKCFTQAELLRIRTIGKVGVNEVKDALANIGTSLLSSSSQLQNSVYLDAIRQKLLAIAAELEAQ
tara:strand:- start:44 stop:469 length:426 start_codon:yes stop_codon:yes gene_type:complete